MGYLIDYSGHLLYSIVFLTNLKQNTHLFSYYSLPFVKHYGKDGVPGIPALVFPHQYQNW